MMSREQVADDGGLRFVFIGEKEATKIPVTITCRRGLCAI